VQWGSARPTVIPAAVGLTVVARTAHTHSAAGAPIGLKGTGHLGCRRRNKNQIDNDSRSNAKVSQVRMKSKIHQRPSASRSANMRAIKPKNSRMELHLRRALWHGGLRYRLHLGSIPGKPDIAFVRERVAVFCDSEFWHGFDWKNRRRSFKTNRDFWIEKIESNIARDRKVNRILLRQGWRVLRFWEREIFGSLDACVNMIRKEVRNDG
jgi:DNA mismatch endonuclease (patch repair protein)